ncbi:MAG TPA: AI-2E family transporter, partial [Bryobacteraceae bacterium]
VLTFFTLFFFLRDGRQLVNRTARLLPLDDDQIEQIVEETQTSIRANVVGVVAVGGVQGVLLGIGFSVLGVPSPLLWALVTCVCSVIPFFGAGLVWVPGALYLVLAGSWVKGLILAGWGAGVVSLSDNIVRPWVISERLRLSPGILFFALLGGVEMFGPLGVFLGPVIVSVTLSLAKMLLNEWRRRPAA